MTGGRDVQLAAKVPAALAADVRTLAAQSERSTAAEIRLALRHWVETQGAPATPDVGVGTR